MKLIDDCFFMEATNGIPLETQADWMSQHGCFPNMANYAADALKDGQNIRTICSKLARICKEHGIKWDEEEFCNLLNLMALLKS